MSATTSYGGNYMDQIPVVSGYAGLVNDHTSATDRCDADTSAAWLAPVSVLPTRYVDSSAPRPESVLPASFGSTSDPRLGGDLSHSVVHAASIKLTDAL